jgi:hypothetical protein
MGVVTFEAMVIILRTVDPLFTMQPLLQFLLHLLMAVEAAFGLKKMTDLTGNIPWIGVQLKTGDLFVTVLACELPMG